MKTLDGHNEAEILILRFFIENLENIETEWLSSKAKLQKLQESKIIRNNK